MRWIAASLLVMSTTAAVAQRQSDAAAKAFADEKTGVSFRYPKNWHVNAGNGGSVEVTPFADRGFTRGSAVYLGANDASPYANTTLVGTEFLYWTGKTGAHRQCSDLLGDNKLNSKALPPRVVRGRTFQRLAMTSGWLCHAAREELYFTDENGTCYLFDLASERECFGAVDGERDLTQSEWAEIQTRLDRIMSTVSIRGPKEQ